MLASFSTRRHVKEVLGIFLRPHAQIKLVKVINLFVWTTLKTRSVRVSNFRPLIRNFIVSGGAYQQFWVQKRSNDYLLLY